MAWHGVSTIKMLVQGEWPACRDFLSVNSGTEDGIGFCWINARVQPRRLLEAGLTDLWVVRTPEARLAQLGDIVQKLDHVARHMAADSVGEFRDVVQDCQAFLATGGFSSDQVIAACGFGGLLLCGAGPHTLEHMYKFAARA